MKKTALIMAGGRGERFWPKSRSALPKQFLSLTGDGKTMIQLTVERIRSLVALEDIYVATNESYRPLVAEQLPGLPEENILCEPVGRNTAACIGLAALHMERKYGDAVMIVLPSDHLIQYTAMFQRTLSDACAVAAEGENLATIGITPDAPETGYGYIRFKGDCTCGRAFAVDRFVEKPDLATAKQYLQSEEYLWNSGMFVWKISSILAKLRRHMPESWAHLERIGAAMGTDREERVLRGEFAAMPSVSIDYGVMEKAENIWVLAGAFGWDDVGSWLAVERFNKSNEFGNVVSGDFITINTRNCILQGGDKLIAAVGVKDLIVVDAGDALLICQKDSAGDIKKVLETLKNSNRMEYV